eukprot:4827223-Pleurochrysis_carterae.AAC.5
MPRERPPPQLQGKLQYQCASLSAAVAACASSQGLRRFSVGAAHPHCGMQALRRVVMPAQETLPAITTDTESLLTSCFSGALDAGASGCARGGEREQARRHHRCLLRSCRVIYNTTNNQKQEFVLTLKTAGQQLQDEQVQALGAVPNYTVLLSQNQITARNRLSVFHNLCNGLWPNCRSRASCESASCCVAKFHLFGFCAWNWRTPAQLVLIIDDINRISALASPMTITVQAAAQFCKHYD